MGDLTQTELDEILLGGVTHDGEDTHRLAWAEDRYRSRWE